MKDRYKSLANNDRIQKEETVSQNYTFASENIETLKKNVEVLSLVDKNNAILVEDSIFNMAFRPNEKYFLFLKKFFLLFLSKFSFF